MGDSCLGCEVRKVVMCMVHMFIIEKKGYIARFAILSEMILLTGIYTIQWFYKIMKCNLYNI